MRAIFEQRELSIIEIRNRTYDQLRTLLREQRLRERAGRSNRHHDGGIDDDTNDETSILLDPEMLDHLLEHTRLGALEKMILYLSFYEQLPDEEVGRRIGKSRQTVNEIKRDVVSRIRTTALRIVERKERDGE